MLDDRALERPVDCALERPSASVWPAGTLSLMNITPWPTKTSSPISTPSQMNVWLWILQRAPIVAPR